MSKARLRTKTGCFTCRGRRVKCGEEHPKCVNCSSSNLSCSWPTAVELYDHRHRHLRKGKGSMYLNLVLAGVYPPCLFEDKKGSHTAKASSSLFQISLKPVSVPYREVFRSDLEYRLFHYFCDTFLYTILLSNAHSGFYNQYRTFLGGLSLQIDSVKWAILACAAMNRSMLTNDEELCTTSLNYYSHAISQVNEDLRQTTPHKSPSDGVLTAIMYLYIFSLLGLDTTDDTATHVEGAVWAVNQRLANSPDAFSMIRVADRVILESVIYQSCLLAIRQPFEPGFEVDHGLIIWAESTLQSLTFADASPVANSPVLGLPLQLYRLVLRISHFASFPYSLDQTAYAQLQEDLDLWQCSISKVEACNNAVMDFEHYTDLYFLILVLYTTAASVLLDLALGISKHGLIDPASFPIFTSQGKLQKALQIVRCAQANECWTRCFLGPWALQVLGYAAAYTEDIVLIQMTLHNMEKRMGYGEVTRILNRMEPVWLDRIERSKGGAG